MKIFALECSGAQASAAFADGRRVAGEFYLASGQKHSRTLLPMVEALLKTGGFSLADADVFAVCAGPGSFTGVRIGVAALKGLADAADKPCFPVSALETTAYPFADRTAETVCAVMDARCRQVYTARFRAGERLTPDEALTIDTLGEQLQSVEGPIRLTGDGAALVFEALSPAFGSRLLCAAPAERYPRAAFAALLAEEKLARGETPVPAGKLMPVYLRLPQAERELQKKTKQKEQTV